MKSLLQKLFQTSAIVVPQQCHCNVDEAAKVVKQEQLDEQKGGMRRSDVTPTALHASNNDEPVKSKNNNGIIIEEEHDLLLLKEEDDEAGRFQYEHFGISKEEQQGQTLMVLATSVCQEAHSYFTDVSSEVSDHANLLANELIRSVSSVSTAFELRETTAAHNVEKIRNEQEQDHQALLLEDVMFSVEERMGESKLDDEPSFSPHLPETASFYNVRDFRIDQSIGSGKLFHPRLRSPFMEKRGEESKEDLLIRAEEENDEYIEWRDHLEWRGMLISDLD